MIEIDNIMTSEKFNKAVIELVTTKSMNYLDAISAVCEDTGIEYEKVSKLIGPKMKKILMTEATGLNLLKIKQGRRLPI